MCHKKCSCNSSNCDPVGGKCLGENAKIVFDVAHNRSSGVTKLSSDRIKAKHWISVNGNGKMNFRNCSDPDDQCELYGGNSVNSSADQQEVNSTALIQELVNLTNLTKELEAGTDKSIVIVNRTIAIHHIKKGAKGFDGAGNNSRIESKLHDLITGYGSSTELNYIETENQEGDFQDQNEDLDESEGVDHIGEYNHIVQVFAVSSINTTKSVILTTGNLVN